MELISVNWEHLLSANISLGAKHSGNQSLLLTNKLSAGIREPLHSLDLRTASIYTKPKSLLNIKGREFTLCLLKT